MAKKYNYKQVIEQASRGHDAKMREAYRIYSKKYNETQARLQRQGEEMYLPKLNYHTFSRNYFAAASNDLIGENQHPTPAKIADLIVSRDAYSRSRPQARILQELAKKQGVKLTQRGIMSGKYDDKISTLFKTEEDKFIAQYAQEHGVMPSKRQIREHIRISMIGSR